MSEADDLRTKLASALEHAERSTRSAYLLRCALDRVIAWNRAPMTPEARALEWQRYVLPAIEEAVRRSSVASH